MNFLFFEHGFKKLSLKEVSLSLDGEKENNHSKIICADDRYYIPKLLSYGEMFLPDAQTGKDADYNKTDEYKLRSQVFLNSVQRFIDERTESK